VITIERDSSGALKNTGNERRGKRIWGIIAVLLVVAFPLGIVFAVLESSNQQWVRCNVTHAESVEGTRFNASPWIVAIETTDCGRMTYTKGVSEDNVQEIAQAFEPGAYEFKLGFTSRLAADGWVPFLRPSAQEYRVVEE